jgi:hypothetical protein
MPSTEASRESTLFNLNGRTRNQIEPRMWQRNSVGVTAKTCIFYKERQACPLPCRSLSACFGPELPAAYTGKCAPPFPSQ